MIAKSARNELQFKNEVKSVVVEGVENFDGDTVYTFPKPKNYIPGYTMIFGIYRSVGDPIDNSTETLAMQSKADCSWIFAGCAEDSRLEDDDAAIIFIMGKCCSDVFGGLKVSYRFDPEKDL